MSNTARMQLGAFNAGLHLCHQHLSDVGFTDVLHKVICDREDFRELVQGNNLSVLDLRYGKDEVQITVEYPEASVVIFYPNVAMNVVGNVWTDVGDVFVALKPGFIGRTPAERMTVTEVNRIEILTAAPAGA